jgi:hypothetical protein
MTFARAVPHAPAPRTAISGLFIHIMDFNCNMYVYFALYLHVPAGKKFTFKSLIEENSKRQAEEVKEVSRETLSSLS